MQQRIEDEFDEVAYQLGFDPEGDLRSVAVVSRTYGRVMMLGEPARWARQQLHGGHVVAGTPRHDTGVGDLQLLYTARGTTAFIRREKATVRDGVVMPSEYVMLRPPATDAWVAAMELNGAWLWPEVERDSIRLVGENHSHSVGKIRVTALDEAVLDTDNGRYRFGPSTLRLTLTTLRQLGMPSAAK